MNRNYDQQYIIQMDETPTYKDMAAGRTIDVVNKKQLKSTTQIKLLH